MEVSSRLKKGSKRKQNRPLIASKLERTGPHPRNSFQGSYDMEKLCSLYPRLAPFIIPPFERSTRQKLPTIDFADPLAIRALNAALLVAEYGVDPSYSDTLPKESLVPPVPGRADYLHHVADILGELSEKGIAPKGPNVRGLDVGTGATCIYPLIATSSYGWSLVASELNPTSFDSATRVVTLNGREDLIEVRLQRSSKAIFDGVWGPKEQFDFTMCNPPFYASEEAFLYEHQRKQRGLAQGGAKKGGDEESRREEKASSNNFGGVASELWCDGGEVEFVKRMIDESQRYANSCLWFSSLVSREENLNRLLMAFQKRKVAKGSRSPASIRTLSIGAGKKSASILLWSFMNSNRQQEWARGRWR